ncbi:MAG: ATP-binding cassette domain-containing protein [Deltaproteobacteria bacterium]|nr:ATP-binding cassette domain-containing protein [Deltaproteobacteria bacterium]
MSEPPQLAKPVTIAVRDVWKSYDGQPVLRGVRLEVLAGETLVIIGGSGEGKSVLIRQIIGLETPDHGEIRLNDSTVAEYRRLPMEEKPFRASMVFQTSALLNSLTVAENVSLALREHRSATREEIRGIVRECLEQVDLAGTEDKMPAELSGGMRKRVAIARALAVRSDLILYDEPTAELDPLLTEEVGALIRRIQDRRRPTQVVVTHNLPLAREIADHVAVLRHGEIVDYRTGDDFFHSEHPHTRNFLRAARVV